MEGTKNRLKRAPIAIIIMVLFHAVGLAGFLLPALRPVFLQIVPFHLWLMLVVIAYSYGQLDMKFITFALLIYYIGFLSEWLGVHKGLIFGNYRYGRTLGFSVADIPLTMGANWFLLIYAAGVLMRRIRLKFIPLRALTGAALLVLLDVLIEPVAQRFDYWHWAGGQVPVSNYWGWFGVSCISLLLFEMFKFRGQSWAAPVFLLVQFVFFGLLRLA